MKLAVIAGEASGDRQAASLISEIKKTLEPEETVELWGIGGSALREIGCDIVMDSSHWGTIGVVESSKQLFSLLFAMARFKRHFRTRRPDLLLLVDFGAFNIPLGAWVKDLYGKRGKLRHGDGCTVCYYFPPSSWRRKMSPNKLTKLADVSDIIFTPFPWSAELLRSVGGNAYFVGHPLLDNVKSTLVINEFDKAYGLDNNRIVITLLPGSREHEIRHILPVQLGAAASIARRLPGVQFLIARAGNIQRSLIAEILDKALKEDNSADLLHFVQQAGDLIKQATSVLSPSPNGSIPVLATPEGLLLHADDPERTKPWSEVKQVKGQTTAPIAIVENDTLNAIARADLIIAASGTATLEAAILGTPQIIMYRGSQLMNIEYKFRQKALNITYIGLPNILANSPICPEFVQDDATVHNVSEKALDFLLQPDRLLEMRQGLREIVQTSLGEPGATKRTALKLLEFMNYKRVATNADSAESRIVS